MLKHINYNGGKKDYKHKYVRMSFRGNRTSIKSYY